MKFVNKIKYCSALALAATALSCSGGSGGLAPGDDSDSENNVGNAGSSGGGTAGTTSGGGTNGNPVKENPTETIPDVVVEVSGPPSGCENGASATALTLTLSSDIRLADLEVRDGAIFVNDTACTASGNSIQITNMVSLTVNGGADSEAVLLDMSSGDWSTLLSTEASLQIDLGEGNNSVVVTSDDTDNRHYHGMLEGEPVVDLTGDTVVNLVASGASRVGLDLGAGNDIVGDLAEALSAASGDPEYTLPTEFRTLKPLSISLVAFGGAGDDSITGGSADDTLGGGPGSDVLNGLAGTDQFTSSESMDGTDILNGGPDYDISSYASREAALVLQLCISEQQAGCDTGTCDCEPSGEVGEADLLVNIEGVTGGAGDDMLIGTLEAETLIGGLGDDELHGGPGPDVLLGGRGLDVLDGGADEDICDSQPSEEPVQCEI